MVSPFRRGVWSRVGLHVGPAMAPAEVTPATLQVRIQELLDEPT
jgi:hypothetical protein